MNDVTYSISEMSGQSGWSIHMLRYYEKEGLLPPIERDENGYRCYTQGNLQLIHFLNKLRLNWHACQPDAHLYEADTATSARP